MRASRRQESGGAMNTRWFGLAVCLGMIGCIGTRARLQSPDAASEREARERTIGEISEFANTDPRPVMGVGLVVDLHNSGGGMPPASSWRSVLEQSLKKHKIRDVAGVLSHPDHTMVLVTAVVRPGMRKGDSIDVVITLPDGSRCTSLRGGNLLETELYTYDSTRNVNPGYKGADHLLRGDKLVVAEGPILIGMDGKARVAATKAGAKPQADVEEVSAKSGRIWGGGRCLVDPPLALVLKPEHQYSRVAAQVASRINQTFPGSKLGNDTMAVAKNKSLVLLAVPSQYRGNLPHYLRVIRSIPLDRNPPLEGAYRKKWSEQLLDPSKALAAAIRLEALGEESAPTLVSALRAPSPWTRFAAAQSLAYMRKPACAEELARLAREQPVLRSYCLAALSSLNESACQIRLADLMRANDPELRYGAFCGLRKLDERDPEVAGQNLNNAFWLHQVANDSRPMVHVLHSKRPEIVLFGGSHTLAPPFRLAVGEDFTITANKDDAHCTVSRFSRKGEAHKQCSLELADALKALVEIGGGYSDALDLLRIVDETGRLSCDLYADTLPRHYEITELANVSAKDPQMRNPVAILQAAHREPAQ